MTQSILLRVKYKMRHEVCYFPTWGFYVSFGFDRHYCTEQARLQQRRAGLATSLTHKETG